MKLCIIGAFGFDRLEQTTGGQPVKTRQLYHTLSKQYGKEQVACIETYGWKKHPFRMLRSVFREAKRCDAMIMLPAHNGLPVFARLLTVCQKKYGIKIFYDVIGGWLPEKTRSDSGLRKRLSRFDGIWVETAHMQTALCAQGLANVTVVPNFRDMRILSPDELVYPQADAPLKLCTFSRVMREKGIEEAVEAVHRLNGELGREAFTLDIYGPVAGTDADWFEGLRPRLCGPVTYRGCVAPANACATLRHYACLLFPTRFFTEGIPGTIVDAYAAGIPVISSRWSSFSDVVDEGRTGLGYDFNDREALVRILRGIAEKPDALSALKLNCIAKAHDYHADSAIRIITADLENKSDISDTEGIL